MVRLQRHVGRPFATSFKDGAVMLCVALQLEAGRYWTELQNARILESACEEFTNAT